LPLMVTPCPKVVRKIIGYLVETNNFTNNF